MQYSQSSHTAVLYFSLSPAAEARKKTFAYSSEYRSNVRIAELLRDHTSRQISRSGLPCFLFDEGNQTGKTFGEKIVNAFSVVFDEGYDNVIAVGNDTPGLRTRHLTQASELLSEGKADVVLGPAADGGTWLMGFSRSAFTPDKIESLPWNSSSLFSTISDRFDACTNLYVLEQFEDIDCADDLESILYRQYSDTQLRRLRQQILLLIDKADNQAVEKRLLTNTNSYHYSFLLRGPPSTSDVGTYH